MERDAPAIAIRELQPEDYAAVVEIGNLIFPDNRTTVEEARWEDESWDAQKYVRRRYVAVDPSGAVAGESTLYHTPNSFHPSRFGLWIAVHPDLRRRGIGGALYEHIVREARALDGNVLRSYVQESLPEGLGWLERRGFRELLRTWESRLDLGTFDPEQFARHREPPVGVEIASLAEELARTSEAVVRMFGVENAVAPDMPRIDPHTPMDFDMYRKRVLESPGSDARAIFIAKDGDGYVGLTELFKSEAQPEVLYTGTTGVRREYRGRGVAFALKVRALDWAKRNGFREVRTWNNTRNAAMLGINMKLGFVRYPPWITFGKELTG